MAKEYHQDRGVCLECGDSFISLRNTMKFCCEKCRWDYYNRVNSSERNARRRSMREIERNYVILNSLVGEGCREISLLKLLGMGFVSNRVTAVAQLGDHLELSVYDISYKQREGLIYDIEKVSLTLRRCKKDKPNNI